MVVQDGKQYTKDTLIATQCADTRLFHLKILYKVNCHAISLDKLAMNIALAVEMALNHSTLTHVLNKLL